MWPLRRMTGAFTWPSRLWHFFKCLLNLSLQEQPLLPVLDVFNADWAHVFQGAAGCLFQRITELKTQHSAAEHRGAHRKQDQRYRATSLQEQGIHHHLTGDPLHNCRQANDSQLLTSWVRKHGLATYVHERLECHWSISLQSNQRFSGYA